MINKQTPAPQDQQAEATPLRDQELRVAEFNRGYVIACCNMVNLHGFPEIAFDVLRELGITKAQVEAFDLSEYDQKAIADIRKARGSQSPFLDGRSKAARAAQEDRT